MPYIFSRRGHRNTFFSVKVRRVISVIRGRLLKEAARPVSALTEVLGHEEFIRTIGWSHICQVHWVPFTTSEKMQKKLSFSNIAINDFDAEKSAR